MTLRRSYALGRRLALVTLGIVAVMLLGTLVWPPEGVDGWHHWGRMLRLALAVFGLTVVLVRARHESARWMSMVVAFAGLVFGGAMVAFDVAPGLEATGLSPGDVGYLVWGGAMVTYLVRHLFTSERINATVHLLDAAMMSLALIFVLWEWVIEPGVGDLADLSLVHQVAILIVPWFDLFVGSILLLLLLVDRSPARLLWFVAMVSFTIGDLAKSITGEVPTRATVIVDTVFWNLGLVLLIVAVGLPAGARLAARRPTLGRLLLVNGCVTLALWVAIWAYVLHTSPVDHAATVIGLVAGAVWAAEHAAAFRQSTTWADKLNDNIDELERAHEELRALLDDLPEAVVVLGDDGCIREANAHTLALTGRTRAELLGHTFDSLFREEDRPMMWSLWNTVRAGGPVPNSTFTFDLPDGTEVLLEADANLPLANPERVVVALRDVTERVAEARRLEKARERFRLAFHNAPTGMALSTMRDGVLIDVNESLVRMLGRTREALIGSTIDDISHPEERGRSAPLLQRVEGADVDGYRVERRFLRGDGGTVWARTWVSIMDDGEGGELAIAHIEDITEQRHTAERMEWAATHDGLTGLPNRFRVLERLGSYIESAEPGSIAVLFIDIDNFKVINDSLGHDAGDQLLRAMSDRLRAVVRDRDLLGRFGGDEFIVMLRDVSGSYDPFDVAERLRAEIAKPLLVDGAELFVTASIGITISDREGVTTSEMLRDADAAMYRAKSRGRDCVEVFAPGSHDASVLTLRTTNELRRGLERGEIVPYYQPIVQLNNGHLIGFEVLARWRHPDRGLLGPEQFLPMAEETGLIGEVGSVVLRSSLVQLGQWRNSTHRFSDLSLSVNLSARQLTDPHLVEHVGEALAEAGVSAGALWLELTETALMSDVKVATKMLRELRSLGLHLSVDDFGTGYSSLTYLKRFPVEAIKVDRSFVNGLGIDAEDSTIVEAVVKLGHSLGLQVVAEGVETPLQLSRLREIGCDRGQGYLFGRPRPAELIENEYSLT
ncbi:MAG: EAL domain-containing protein [Actinobacteria bacterium]|nr:EAL domain-containing protein [Actinomycetota bacterium]